MQAVPSVSTTVLAVSVRLSICLVGDRGPMSSDLPKLPSLCPPTPGRPESPQGQLLTSNSPCTVSWDWHRYCRCCYWPGLWPAYRVQPPSPFAPILSFQEKVVQRLQIRQLTIGAYSLPSLVPHRHQHRSPSLPAPRRACRLQRGPVTPFTTPFSPYIRGFSVLDHSEAPPAPEVANSQPKAVLHPPHRRIYDQQQ